MPEESTGSSATATLETAGAGTEGATQEGTTQESKAPDPKFVELEARALRATELERELNEQKQRADDLAKNLKSHQQNTTAKLQEAADQRRQNAVLQGMLQGELAEVKMGQQKLLEALLDEDQRKAYMDDMREQKLRQREQALQAAAQQQQRPAPVDMEQYKEQLFNTYAADAVGIEVNDPRIDWAGDVGNDINRWLPRFRASIGKIQRETFEAERQSYKASVEETTKAAVKAAQDAAAEAARLAAEEARRESEMRLRAAGVNVTSAVTPEGAQGRKAMQEIQEELPDSLLYENPKEYARRLAALNSKHRGY